MVQADGLGGKCSRRSQAEITCGAVLQRRPQAGRYPGHGGVDQRTRSRGGNIKQHPRRTAPGVAIYRICTVLDPPAVHLMWTPAGGRIITTATAVSVDSHGESLLRQSAKRTGDPHDVLIADLTTWRDRLRAKLQIGRGALLLRLALHRSHQSLLSSVSFEGRRPEALGRRILRGGLPAV